MMIIELVMTFCSEIQILSNSPLPSLRLEDDTIFNSTENSGSNLTQYWRDVQVEYITENTPAVQTELELESQEDVGLAAQK